MAIQLDAAFIDEWGPKFEARGIGAEYEGEYPGIVKAVALEIKSSGTLSKELFLRIWNWKGAMRVIRHIRIKEYPSLYAPAFRRAVNEPPARKLLALLGEGQKLPGVGAPTGSTILHFIHPEYMPIIDIRTVETLYEAGASRRRCVTLTTTRSFERRLIELRKTRVEPSGKSTRPSLRTTKWNTPQAPPPDPARCDLAM
jgi:hypothetical protein